MLVWPKGYSLQYYYLHVCIDGQWPSIISCMKAASGHSSSLEWETCNENFKENGWGHLAIMSIWHMSGVCPPTTLLPLPAALWHTVAIVMAIGCSRHTDVSSVDNIDGDWFTYEGWLAKEMQQGNYMQYTSMGMRSHAQSSRNLWRWGMSEPCVKWVRPVCICMVRGTICLCHVCVVRATLVQATVPIGYNRWTNH